MRAKSLAPLLVAAAGAASFSPASVAQGTDTASGPLASYFGFDALRVLVVDDNAGPVKIADVNNDGLDDLIVVNDSKSRMEFHLQRTAPRTDDEMDRDFEPNELAPSPFFDREFVTLQHAVASFDVADLNGDGLLDVVYAGRPFEVVSLVQSSPMRFEIESRKRVRDLTGGEDGLRIVNVMGDASPELLTLVDGSIHVWSMEGAALVGEPKPIGSQIGRFWIEDYNGDGMMDVLGSAGDADAPLRMWLQRAGTTPNQTQLSAEVRFDMPAITEAEPVRIDGKDAASIAVLERASRRLVLYELTSTMIDGLDLGGERDAQAEIRGFGSSARDRSVAVGDVTGDGLADLVTASEDANGVLLFTQTRGTGLNDGRLFSSFKEPKKVTLGQWDDDDALEVFVLSEEESIVGVSDYDPRTGRLGFPQPIDLGIGDATPVSMAVAQMADTMTGDLQNVLVVVAREGRDYLLSIATKDSQPEVVAAEEVERVPEAIIASDFDGDGMPDLAFLTPNESLLMASTGAGDSGTTALLTSEDMPQFGLVESAGPNNTVLYDVDGDGRDELVFATENFVRAASFDAETGWRVVDQITLPDTTTNFTGLTVVTAEGRERLVASDSQNDLLMVMSPASRNSVWEVTDTLALRGMDAGALFGGSFDGNGNPGVIALASDAFGVVRFSGVALSLESIGGWRSDEDEPRPHEIEVGDINSDGFTDVIVLDDADKLCQVFSISEAGNLLFAMEFKVFEERLFFGGQATFEPSYIYLGDINNDGLQDLILQAHDRFLMYPQGEAR